MFEQTFAFADATPSAEEVQIRNKRAAMFLATLLGIYFEYLHWIVGGIIYMTICSRLARRELQERKFSQLISSSN